MFYRAPDYFHIGYVALQSATTVMSSDYPNIPELFSNLNEPRFVEPMYTKNEHDISHQNPIDTSMLIRIEHRKLNLGNFWPK